METNIKLTYSNNLQMEIDLNYAETIAHRGPVYLGIPIFRILPYSQTLDITDKYRPVRQWYRNKIQKFGGLFIIKRTELEHLLLKVQPDAVDYLITWNKEQRKNHKDWLEHSNEAIQIDKWIFPSNAINMAKLTPDWHHEKIKLVVTRDGEEIAHVNYFTKPIDHTIYFSNFGKPQK